MQNVRIIKIPELKVVSSGAITNLFVPIVVRLQDTTI